MLDNHQIVQLKVEKELHEFLSSRASAEGLSLEEYTANIIAKQANLDGLLENIKANKNKYPLSRMPTEDDYYEHNYTVGMDIGCSTLQISDN